MVGKFDTILRILESIRTVATAGEEIFQSFTAGLSTSANGPAIELKKASEKNNQKTVPIA